MKSTTQLHSNHIRWQKKKYVEAEKIAAVSEIDQYMMMVKNGWIHRMKVLPNMLYPNIHDYIFHDKSA